MSRVASRAAARPASAVILPLVTGSVAWSVLMAASAAVSVWQRAWQNDAMAFAVIVLFALGGLASYLPAVMAAAFMSRTMRAETRFAAYLVTLALATIGATAFLFAMHYRLYYASWHESPLTITWAFQFVFTTGVAVYHFLVLGLRFFLPIGFPALLAVSLWHAARAR